MITTPPPQPYVVILVGAFRSPTHFCLQTLLGWRLPDAMAAGHKNMKKIAAMKAMKTGRKSMKKTAGKAMKTSRTSMKKTAAMKAMKTGRKSMKKTAAMKAMKKGRKQTPLDTVADAVQKLSRFVNRYIVDTNGQLVRLHLDIAHESERMNTVMRTLDRHTQINARLRQRIESRTAAPTGAASSGDTRALTGHDSDATMIMGP